MPLGTHPPISVGIGPSKQGMENNDRLVQVPDEHPLQRKNQISVSVPWLKNLVIQLTSILILVLKKDTTEKSEFTLF